MDKISRKSCRICLSESEFNVSLFGSYCRRTDMIDKILVCLKLAIEETDSLNTICYKCAENIERYYEFITFVKKSQMKLVEPRQSEASVNRRHVTSYVREQVFDADYTFSFLDMAEEQKEPKNSSPFFSYFSPPKVVKKVEMPEEKAEPKSSSPFFSYFSPPNLVKKVSEHTWKTPREVEKQELRKDKFARPRKVRARHHSGDLFESQSQDDSEPKSLDWKLTPDDSILKRVRDKCFGRSDF